MRERDVIWLERLANRCKVHGFQEQAAQLREKAEGINALLPEAERIDPMDERCREPVRTNTLSEFIAMAQAALDLTPEEDRPLS